jgi:tyrosinase
MAENDVADQVVASPTYMADIRFFFRPEDVEHMGAKGIELGTYEEVKSNAPTVYAHTAPPNADMPPDAAGKWSANRSQTFRNWIIKGCPLGSATPQAAGVSALIEASGGRIRKNVASLSAQEVQTLQAAFSGLMERDPSDANSYFALAGIHGLPLPISCLHHENRYNPWHRAYLKVFEDALRSVPGCQDATIPYWDIQAPLPALLQQPPFASYKLPRDPGASASLPGTSYFPYTTKRYPLETITQNLQKRGVFDDIETSRIQSRWGASNIGGYQKFSIQAHDGGHLSIGPTMAEQEVAAYDPVFWFFHCNLDRLWLKWQEAVGATTLAGFKTTVDGDTSWLSVPPFNELLPFKTTADEPIAFGISYDEQDLVSSEEVELGNTAGSLEAAHTFTIKRSAPVSVRVKGIDRLRIPGSFDVNLLADGEPIAKRAFFQPRSPRDCDNCRQNALVNIDFRIDQEKLLDRKLSVEIELPTHEEIGTRFPLSQAGNPSINARLLLEEE